MELITTSLNESNISIYLLAVDVVNTYFSASLQVNYDNLMKSIEELLTPLLLRSNDTNTRVRKKSIEAVTSLWNGLFSEINPKYEELVQDSETSLSVKLFEVLTSGGLGEKAILGRL